MTQDRPDPVFAALRKVSDAVWRGQRIVGVRMHPTDAGRLLTSPSGEIRPPFDRIGPELVIDNRQEQGTISYTTAQATAERWKTGAGT